jgi:hypothetical protein
MRFTGPITAHHPVARIMQVQGGWTLRRLAKEHNVMAVATENGGRTVRPMKWY